MHPRRDISTKPGEKKSEHEMVKTARPPRPDGACKQVFTGSGRAQSSAPGILPPKRGELLRVAQEFHDLFKLVFCLVDACNSSNSRGLAFSVSSLSFGLRKAHRATLPPPCICGFMKENPGYVRIRERQAAYRLGEDAGLVLGARARRATCGQRLSATSTPSGGSW